MREELVAWAGDCMVRGAVDMGEGRLSDRVNDADVVTFHDVTVRALDDGRELTLDQVEVERRELLVIEVHGRRGDSLRRLRTIKERATIELGPLSVTGTLHRPPGTSELASLSRHSRFIPMTDAFVEVRGASTAAIHEDVVLVNREQVTGSKPLAVVPVYTGGVWPSSPDGPVAG